MASEVDSELNYRLLKLIGERPKASQRELAADLGLSLGKVNYCLKAFVARGLVKVNNFRRSDNKLAYAYLLTSEGIEEKARVTWLFFRRVEAEYEALKREVERIERHDHGSSAPFPASLGVVDKIISELPGVIAVYAFGSTVSGQMHQDSDLDLAVLANPPIDSEKIWRLAQDIAAMVGREVDLIDLRRASAVMRVQIIQGGKRLYCLDPLACADFEDFVFSDFARLNEERAGILEDIKRRGTVYG
ncbi:MAG: MarR family EPS-associated transcriptional regulator [Mariprofundaceae bacterium]